MSVLEPHNILQKLGAGFIGVFGLGASAYIFSRFFPDSLPIWINGLLLVAGFFVFASWQPQFPVAKDPAIGQVGDVFESFKRLFKIVIGDLFLKNLEQ